jgi:hypothetical protein
MNINNTDFFGYEINPKDGSFIFLFKDNLEEMLKMKKIGITFTKDQLENLGYSKDLDNIFFMFLFAKNVEEAKNIINNTYIKNNYNMLIDYNIIDNITPRMVRNLITYDTFYKEELIKEKS